MKKKAVVWSIILSCLIVLVGLGLLAYLGFYNRYWAEDYCYNRDFKDLGVLKSIGTYFAQGEDAKRGYSTNRYSLTLISGLFYLAGLFGTQIQASVIILLWLAGLFWSASVLFGDKIPRIFLFLGASVLLYFTLIFSPQRFQVLYWQAGVHYSYALIFGVFLVGLIFVKKRSKSHLYFHCGLSAFIGFIAGGLSETACVYLLSGAAVLVAATWWGKRNRQDWAVQAFPAALMALVGLLASFLVLVVSPSNDRYIDMPANHPPQISSLPRLANQYTLFFITNSIRVLPTPHLVFVALFVALPFLNQAFGMERTEIPVTRHLFWIALTVVLTYLLIASVQIPTAYFYSSQPAPRTQTLARFTMFIGIAVLAWNIGEMAAHTFRGNFLPAVALAILLLSAAYMARHISINYQELPGFRYRARVWDLRDQIIREAKDDGILRVEVPVIDTYLINVPDIIRSRQMDIWTSNCGTDYYGIDAVLAIPP